MPSLQHTLATWVVPRLRRNLPVDDLPAMRASLTAANRAANEAPPARVRRGHEERIGNVHGFPVYTLWKPASASGDEPQRSVIYLHGGAYVRPTHSRHWRFVVALADALDAHAVLPAYPLAPEFTVDDSFDELLSLRRGGGRVAGRGGAGRGLRRRRLRPGPGPGVA